MTKIDITENPQTRERHPQPVAPTAQLHWRLYYRDGRTVSSKESTWEAAPATDVVAVVHALDNEPPDCELGTPYYWHHGDWIARVWDPTLYLRQTGQVKFGRWASYALFDSAWRAALMSIARRGHEQEALDERSLQSGGVFHSEAVNDRETGTSWSLYYDNGNFITDKACAWSEAPSDGILCATYACVYSGMKIKMAMRRYTYYLWRGHELINTDNLDEVLTLFPQCKQGQPSFTGASYRHQGEALAAALRDQLEDLR